MVYKHQARVIDYVANVNGYVTIQNLTRIGSKSTKKGGTIHLSKRRIAHSFGSHNLLFDNYFCQPI